MEGFLDTTAQFTGRKAAVGKTFLVKDRDGRERLGVFVAYCPDCKYKVLLTRQEVITLFNRHRKLRSSVRESVIRFLIRRLEFKAPYAPDTRSERHKEYVMSKY